MDTLIIALTIFFVCFIIDLNYYEKDRTGEYETFYYYSRLPLIINGNPVAIND